MRPRHQSTQRHASRRPPQAPQPPQRHRSSSRRRRTLPLPNEGHYSRHRHYSLEAKAESYLSVTHERHVTGIKQPSMRRILSIF